MGSEGLQAKVDHRKNPPSLTRSTAHPSASTLPKHLVHQALFGDEKAEAECLRGLQLVGVGLPQKQDPPKPSSIEYSSKEIESTQTHLEVFAKHSRECITSGRYTHPQAVGLAQSSFGRSAG